MNRYLILFAVVATFGCSDSKEGDLVIKSSSLLVDTIYSNEKKIFNYCFIQF